MSHFMRVLGTYNDRYIVLCTDFEFAVKNDREILDWMERTTPGAIWTGLVIEFTAEQDLLLFMLRWE